MSAFTPGPWKWSRNPHGTIIAQGQYGPGLSVASTLLAFKDFRLAHLPVGWLDEPVVTANARLMAAAPEMFAILNALVAAYHDSAPEILRPTMNAACDVLDKITGEQS